MTQELKAKVQELADLTGINNEVITDFILNSQSTDVSRNLGMFIEYNGSYIYVKAIEPINNDRFYKVWGNTFICNLDNNMFQYTIKKDDIVLIPTNLFHVDTVECISPEEFMEKFSDLKFIDMNAVYSYITDENDYAIEIPVDEPTDELIDETVTDVNAEF